MHLFRRLSVALAVAALMVPVADGAARPRATSWTRVDGPTHAGTQVGLLRTNGVLHVVWAQGTPSTISDTTIAGDGKTMRTSVVASGFDGTGGLGLVGMADGSVRLFAAGGRTTGLGPGLTGINSYVLQGGGWSFDPSSLWGGAVANAADQLGAAVAGNGQPVTAWSGAVVHVGLGQGGGGDPSYQPDCCGADPTLATDGSTGAVVLSWITNGHDEGTYVQQVVPSPGQRVALPSGMTAASSGLASRIGAPGTYVAFTDPNRGKVELYRYGGGTKTLAKGSFRLAKVFTGPGGRLWVVWGDGNSGLVVTRSNRAITAFEPIQHLTLPANTNGLYNAQGEGSADALDLFADLLIGTADRGFWRTHVLPIASLKAHVARTGGKSKAPAKVTFMLTDAGDPIAGGIIVVHAGSATNRLKTDASGQAVVTVPANTPSISATATAPGYASGIIAVARLL